MKPLVDSEQTKVLKPIIKWFTSRWPTKKWKFPSSPGAWGPQQPNPEIPFHVASKLSIFWITPKTCYFTPKSWFDAVLNMFLSTFQTSRIALCHLHCWCVILLRNFLYCLLLVGFRKVYFRGFALKLSKI